MTNNRTSRPSRRILSQPSRQNPSRPSKRIPPRLILCASLALLLLLISLVPSLFCPADPYAQNLSEAKLPPSRQHLLGTDQFGRDVLSRVIAGSQPSILATLALVLLTTAVGTAAGLFCGWRGGWIDTLLMRFSDIFLAFPGLVFALAFAGLFGGGTHHAVLALAIVSWPKYARLARSRTLAVKSSPFLSAARVSGCSPARILLVHVLPNILHPIFTTSLTDIGTMMMELSALSFLGMGAKPPLPEWGSMMSSARSLMMTAPWIIFGPGLAIFLTVMVFNLLGDAVRDLSDPGAKGVKA